MPYSKCLSAYTHVLFEQRRPYRAWSGAAFIVLQMHEQHVRPTLLKLASQSEAENMLQPCQAPVYMLNCNGGVQVPGLQLGPAARFANDSQLFFPVAALLESSVPEESKGALQVCLPSAQLSYVAERSGDCHNEPTQHLIATVLC